MTEEEQEEESEDEFTVDDAAEQLHERAEMHVETANQMHEQLDGMKGWSSDISAEIRGQATLLFDVGVLTENERDELMQQAQRIQTVSQRVTGQ